MTSTQARQTKSKAVPYVAVYCGSKMGVESAFAAGALSLGERLAQARLGLVYGGASIGLMGQVADGCLSQRGKVIGVTQSPHCPD